jgi:hypothetical protein
VCGVLNPSGLAQTGTFALVNLLPRKSGPGEWIACVVIANCGSRTTGPTAPCEPAEVGHILTCVSTILECFQLTFSAYRTVIAGWACSAACPGHGWCEGLLNRIADAIGRSGTPT